MKQSESDLVDALVSISPMPEDESPEMTTERLRKYEELLFKVKDIVDHSLEKPDPGFIDPLIASFGNGHGFELYWSVVTLLERFPPEELVPRLRRAVQQGQPGARKWSAYMLGRQGDLKDVHLLVAALSDPQPEVREQALVALSMIGDITALVAMEQLLSDSEEEVRKTADESIRHLMHNHRSG